ncbi:ferredoxin [Nocardia wallacei]|uniref:ferredoxin n=1 Tax=Nocardia wallacei TaxID=480035 RepID=UPI002456FB75|nr:ferredoxin [Nocardia wallacei]
MSGPAPTGGTVTVDRNRCIGAGHCVSAAPGTFDQDDAGLVVLVAGGAAADGDDVRAAAELCPAAAIALVTGAPPPGHRRECD